MHRSGTQSTEVNIYVAMLREILILFALLMYIKKNSTIMPPSLQCSNVHFSQCICHISAWGQVDYYYDNSGELSWKIVWTALHNHKVCSWITVFGHNYTIHTIVLVDIRQTLLDIRKAMSSKQLLTLEMAMLVSSSHYCGPVGNILTIGWIVMKFWY